MWTVAWNVIRPTLIAGVLTVVSDRMVPESGTIIVRIGVDIEDANSTIDENGMPNCNPGVDTVDWPSNVARNENINPSVLLSDVEEIDDNDAAMGLVMDRPTSPVFVAICIMASSVICPDMDKSASSGAELAPRDVARKAMIKDRSATSVELVCAVRSALNNLTMLISTVSGVEDVEDIVADR